MSTSISLSFSRFPAVFSYLWTNKKPNGLPAQHDMSSKYTLTGLCATIPAEKLPSGDNVANSAGNANIVTKMRLR
jgi:hypothetical protein